MEAVCHPIPGDWGQAVLVISVVAIGHLGLWPFQLLFPAPAGFGGSFLVQSPSMQGCQAAESLIP